MIYFLRYAWSDSTTGRGPIRTVSLGCTGFVSDALIPKVIDGDETWMTSFNKTYLPRARIIRSERPQGLGLTGQSSKVTYKSIMADGGCQLRSLPPGSRREIVLETWGIVGKHVGVNRDDAPPSDEDRHHEILKSRKGKKGCNWFKCLLYEQESGKPLFWCVGCEAALYCGSYCQER